MKKQNPWFFALIAGAVLTGCGGGGGGGGGGTPAERITIASSNYTDVASTPVSSLNQADTLVQTTTTLVGAEISPTGTYSLKSVAYSAAKAVLANWGAFSTSTMAGSVVQNTVSCTNGGTANASVNDADNSQTPSAGDSASVTFNGCNEGGSVLNGSMTMVINSVSGDPFNTPYGSAALNMTFNHVTVGNQQSVDGTISLSFSQTSSTNATASLTFTNLTSTSSAGSVTFGNLSFNATNVGSSGTLTIAGDVYYSKYAGFVLISTPTTVNIDSSGNITGTILFTGKNNTKARIVGLGNSTSLLIEADTNGDDTYDINTTIVPSSIGI